MIDLGIRNFHLYSAFRLKISYTLPDGSPKDASGTGAFIKRSDGAHLLVTCRHLLDSVYAGKYGWKLHSVIAEGFHYAQDLASERRQVFEFVDPPVFPGDPEVDLALLDGRRIMVREGPNSLGVTLEESLLCDELLFKEEISAGDFVVAPGYTNLPQINSDRPILLAGIVASDPRIPIVVNRGLSKSKVVLYQSLSRAGLSGAPLIAAQRGIAFGPTLSGPPHRPMRLIGVNTGHFQESSELPLQYSHFVPSPEILKLLHQAD